MLELISHVVQISSRRDRTEINSAMVDALYQLFHPRRLSIFRCYTGTKKPMSGKLLMVSNALQPFF
jgi:hypothetical protein